LICDQLVYKKRKKEEVLCLILVRKIVLKTKGTGRREIGERASIKKNLILGV